jgi:hypothetical protein
MDDFVRHFANIHSLKSALLRSVDEGRNCMDGEQKDHAFGNGQCGNFKERRAANHGDHELSPLTA